MNLTDLTQAINTITQILQPVNNAIEYKVQNPLKPVLAELTSQLEEKLKYPIINGWSLKEIHHEWSKGEDNDLPIENFLGTDYKSEAPRDNFFQTSIYFADVEMPDGKKIRVTYTK